MLIHRLIQNLSFNQDDIVPGRRRLTKMPYALFTSVTAMIP